MVIYSGHFIGLGCFRSSAIQIACNLFQKTSRLSCPCFYVLAFRCRSKVCSGSEPLSYVVARPSHKALAVGYWSVSVGARGIPVKCERHPLPTIAVLINLVYNCRSHQSRPYRVVVVVQFETKVGQVCFLSNKFAICVDRSGLSSCFASMISDMVGFAVWLT